MLSQGYLKASPTIRFPHKSAVSKLSQSYLKVTSKLSRSLVRCAFCIRKTKENRAPRLARSSLKASSVRPHRGLTTVSQIRFPHKDTASKWSQSYLKVISKLPSSSVKV